MCIRSRCSVPSGASPTKLPQRNAARFTRFTSILTLPILKELASGSISPFKGCKTSFLVSPFSYENYERFNKLSHGIIQLLCLTDLD